MAKGSSKKNKNAQPKPPKDNYIFVVNAWGYQSGNWNWAIVDAWFEAMCKEEGSGMKTEQYFYQRTHGYLIVKLEKDTSKNVSHLFGRHYYRQFLTNRAPGDPECATIHPYNYEKWGDPAKQQWSEEYGMPMPVGRNVPLRVPYPIPEPTTELPPVDAIKWTRQIDTSTYQRLAERYAQANPGWGDSGLSTASGVAPGGADAAEALLASILPPKAVKPEPVTLGKKEEDVDSKATLVVKSEEEKKFKVDPEDVKLPPELLHGSVGQVKSEPADLRVKVDEDGIDRKPFEFPPVDLPPELKHGSVSLGPVTSERIKSEQGDVVRVKPEAPENNLQDSPVREGRLASYVKREEDERASARIKEEKDEYSSGRYKRVKREHLS
ncbi:hypothetical protein D9619_002181 [Psilocybe cf. subviscida]|uniref:Uncharacterized protein n=1 Tax=Psilocybe cf. subviscida TaxID=2480587 RepID=A0A8H5BGN3_9AGAR|nr:hypothetical protein D9619_002181 [Psilocybe cf. subviscida]